MPDGTGEPVRGGVVECDLGRDRSSDSGAVLDVFAIFLDPKIDQV